MDKYTILRINTLLKHIETIINDLDGMSLCVFSKSDLLVRATCFSLIQIGEQMNRLEKDLKELYPNVQWFRARELRNLIVHVYNKVEPVTIYKTAVDYLPILKEEFATIKKELLN